MFNTKRGYPVMNLHFNFRFLSNISNLINSYMHRYSCGLSTATIELCVCVSVCLCTR